MQWSFKRTIIVIGILVAFFVLVITGLSTYRNTVTLIETNIWLANTRGFAAKLDGIFSLLKDAENARRVFVVTGKDRHLDPFYSALTSLNRNVNEMQSFATVHPTLKPQLAALIPLITSRVVLLNESIELVKMKGFEFEEQSALMDKGQQLMDDIKKTITAMEIEQNKLVNQRISDAQTIAHQTGFTLFGGLGLSFILVLIAFSLFQSEVAASAQWKQMMGTEQASFVRQLAERSVQFESAEKELKTLGEERQKTADEFHRIQTELEQRVLSRTMELESVKSELEKQRAVRKAAEDELERMKTAREQTVTEHTRSLESTNRELIDQISLLKQTEQEMHEMNAELEQRIMERTVQYEVGNKELAMQSAERKRIEEELRQVKSEFEQQLMERTVQLEVANKELVNQVAARKHTEDQVQKLLPELERKIMESTVRLEINNQELERQIAARKRAEEEQYNLQAELERTGTRIRELELAQQESDAQTAARKQAADKFDNLQTELKQAAARTHQLEIANQQFAVQLAERSKVEQEMKKLHQELEQQLAERTQQLEFAKSELEQQITDRKKIEAELSKLQTEFEQRIKDHLKQFESAHQELEAQVTVHKQAEDKLNQNVEQLRVTLDETINALASAFEKRYPYMTGHQHRAAQLACAIAREIGLPAGQIEGLRIAGLLYEIGNLYIPGGIISKLGPLNNVELNIIQTHPKIGYDILKAIEFPWPVAQIVVQHHERMNGSGYPSGLSDDNILLESRILAVADTVESMVSPRTYRPALGVDRALLEVSANTNGIYDSNVVAACLDLFTENRFAFELS